MTDTTIPPPTNWFTPKVHRRLMWAVLAIAFLTVGFAYALLFFVQHLDPNVAYHAAGVAMLTQVALWVAVCTYAAWNSLHAARRDIVWAGGLTGSFLLGSIGVVSSIIPVTKIVQTQIWLAGHTVVEVHGDAIKISGAISHDLAERIQEADTRHVTRLELGKNSGGMIRGILNAEPVLRELGVREVVIDGRCASSCALLALMFPTRLMSKDGELGFHSLRAVAGQDKTLVDGDTKKLSDKLVSLGYSRELVASLFSTKELNWYSPEEARSLGLANGCWDSSQETPVPC